MTSQQLKVLQHCTCEHTDFSSYFSCNFIIFHYTTECCVISCTICSITHNVLTCTFLNTFFKNAHHEFSVCVLIAEMSGEVRCRETPKVAMSCAITASHDGVKLCSDYKSFFKRPAVIIHPWPLTPQSNDVTPWIRGSTDKETTCLLMARKLFRSM